MFRLLFIIISAAFCMSGRAQTNRITGSIIDNDTHEAVPMVTVQLLKSDSAFVSGVATSDSGRFVIPAPVPGRYLLKLSCVGYNTQVKRLNITDNSNLDLGRIVMTADAIMLREARVTAKALKVTVQEDTFVYNSAAYRTPEGSTIEELVKRLPGATVSDDGKITINGKEVKKIMVDGKEFMTGDTKTALKNIPTSIIDKVKAYDEKSDLTKVTGIDDGEEQTVLDFGTKPGMGKGLMANADVAAGTENRYSARLFGGYFDKKMRVFAMANANNVNDMGFGGRGGNFGRNRNGLNATKMAGVNLNYENKDKLKVDGSVRWNHSNGDVQSVVSSENFVNKSGSFGNSVNQAFSRTNNWNAQFRVEWQPDSLTNINIRPTASLSSTDGVTQSQSATFNDDPYKYVEEPLSEDAITTLDEDRLVVNHKRGNRISYSENNSVGTMVQVNRKLNAKGRNLTFQGNVRYSDGNSNNLTLNSVRLFKVSNRQNEDSVYHTNRYSVTPSKNYSMYGQLSYSEPLWRGTYLQLRYRYTYSYKKSDRQTYDFSLSDDELFSGLVPHYRGWNGYLAQLESGLDNYKDDNLSRYAKYQNYAHLMEATLRMTFGKYRMNVGFMVLPQRSHYVQQYQGLQADTIRNVVNFSPTFDLRYRFNKVSNLRINYRGESSQPDISQLLNVYDDSDPLNIVTGNPGLKPSFTQNLRFFYNAFFQKTQRSLMANLNLSTTSNSISSKTTYNDVTGGTITRPENINGQWNLNSAFMFNTPLDSAGVFNLNTFTTADYANNVGYVTQEDSRSSVKANTRDLTLGERLSASYRNSWLEVELDGNVQYRNTRNPLQSTANLNTWQFAYGVNFNLSLPWGTQLSTDLHENSRRGYQDHSLNTNELVWNMQVSQSFLKNNALTLMLQFYDILKQQSSFSRTVSAISRTDSEYNAINSYAMLHVIYKLNLFGGKLAEPNGRRRDRGDNPNMGRPGRFGNDGVPPMRGGMGRPMM